MVVIASGNEHAKWQVIEKDDKYYLSTFRQISKLEADKVIDEARKSWKLKTEIEDARKHLEYLENIKEEAQQGLI
jgi:hypothetical protein